MSEAKITSTQTNQLGRLSRLLAKRNGVQGWRGKLMLSCNIFIPRQLAFKGHAREKMALWILMSFVNQSHAELIATFKRAEADAAHKFGLIKTIAKQGPKAIEVAIETAAKAAKRRDTYAKKLTALGVVLTD